MERSRKSDRLSQTLATPIQTWQGFEERRYKRRDVCTLHDYHLRLTRMSCTLPGAVSWYYVLNTFPPSTFFPPDICVCEPWSACAVKLCSLVPSFMRNKVQDDAGKTYYIRSLFWLIIPSAYRQPERLSLEAELLVTRLPLHLLLRGYKCCCVQTHVCVIVFFFFTLLSLCVWTDAQNWILVYQRKNK